MLDIHTNTLYEVTTDTGKTQYMLGSFLRRALHDGNYYPKAFKMLPVDKRYTVTPEYADSTAQQFVVRFQGEYLDSFPTEKEAHDCRTEFIETKWHTKGD